MLRAGWDRQGEKRKHTTHGPQRRREELCPENTRETAREPRGIHEARSEWRDKTPVTARTLCPRRGRSARGGEGGRTYAQIIREDVFTLINNLLFVLCAALLLLGQISEAMVSAGAVLFNVVISVVQEIRAKRALDRIALLTCPRATVIRDGRERAIDPGELVEGDLLVLRTGDQVVVDGSLISAGHVEIDESLLTGESEPITKHAGAQLSSGSYCLSGTACYRAEHVGMESVTGQLTARARAFRRTLTPLQWHITVVIQALLLVALYIETILLLIALANQTAIVEVVRMSVIVVGIVPIGLFLATSVAYALGAF
jgi:cation-transporting P-type ATPase E